MDAGPAFSRIGSRLSGTMAGVPALVSVALLAGCGGELPSGAKPGDTAILPLVGDAELGPLEARLLARLEANRVRRCPRPPLRGEALAGTADADMVAVLEPEGTLAGCLEAAGRDDISDALVSGDELVAHAWPRPLDDPAARSAAVARLTASCAMLPAALARAVGHEDSCSLYLTGRRRLPESLLGVMHAGRAAVLLSRDLSRRGKTREALQLLLDVVRLGQDLGRGGTPWVVAIIGVVSSILPLRTAGVLLDARPALSAGDARVLGNELDALLASEPHVSGPLVNDLTEMQLYFLLPAFKEDGWVPPGGWPVDFDPARSGSDPARSALESEFGKRGGNLLTWYATDELMADFARVCPPSSTVVACVVAVERLAGELAGKAKPGIGDALALLSTDVPGVREKVRRMVIDILKGLAGPPTVKYVRMATWRAVGIAALRLQLALAGTEASGRCPSPELFAAPPVSALAAPPSLGTPLRLATSDPAVLEIAPPTALERPDDERRIRFRMRCR